MKSVIKLTALLLILASYIYEFSFVYADNVRFQLISLIVIAAACLIRFGRAKLLSEIRLFIPFITAMLGVYTVIGLLGFKPVDTDNYKSVFMYWLMYGLSRTALFAGTMLVMQMLLSYITINDILSLPMPVSRKRYLLLGRALFVHSIRYVEELEFHLNLLPEHQTKSKSIRQWYRLKLELSLAIILMLLRESRLKGELIDNRIKHCFKETA